MKIAKGQPIALDTNILVYADDTASSFHPMARRLLEEALKGTIKVCLTQQILAEYFSVITSARRVKYPLSPMEAKDRVLFLERSRKIKTLYPKRSTFKRCVEAASQHGIGGAQIFDAFYAVALLDNKIRHICTQNAKDFVLFNDLHAFRLEDMEGLLKE